MTFLRPAPELAQLIDRLVMDDAQQPGRRPAPPAVKPPGAPPDSPKRFLDDLFGAFRRPGHPEGQTVGGRPVAVVEHAKRIRLPGGDRSDYFVVGQTRPILDRPAAWPVDQRKCRTPQDCIDFDHPTQKGSTFVRS